MGDHLRGFVGRNEPAKEPDKHVLTTRELEVLNFIEFYRQSSAASPSFEDVKLGAGMKSLSHAAKVIYSLEEKGWIVRKPGKWRSITLVNVADPPPMKLYEPGYD